MSSPLPLFRCTNKLLLTCCSCTYPFYNYPSPMRFYTILYPRSNDYITRAPYNTIALPPTLEDRVTRLVPLTDPNINVSPFHRLVCRPPPSYPFHHFCLTCSTRANTRNPRINPFPLQIVAFYISFPTCHYPIARIKETLNYERTNTYHNPLTIDTHLLSVQIHTT